MENTFDIPDRYALTEPSRKKIFVRQAISKKVLVNLINKIAAGKSVTPAKIAPAWVLAQKPWIVPIAGTRKLSRLGENSGAAEVELTAGGLRDLNAALAKIEISGDRRNTFDISGAYLA